MDRYDGAAVSLAIERRKCFQIDDAGDRMAARKTTGSGGGNMVDASWDHCGCK
jgi:hypothetical protein